MGAQAKGIGISPNVGRMIPLEVSVFQSFLYSIAEKMETDETDNKTQASGQLPLPWTWQPSQNPHSTD